MHSLEVPVSKEPTWLADTMRSYLHRLTINPEKVPQEEREHAAALANWDVRQEVDWLLGFLKTVDSPVVFSHNDINTGNILVREDPSSWDPVVFIDYEFAAYNYRAFDIANHFNEWMYDYGRKVTTSTTQYSIFMPLTFFSNFFRTSLTITAAQTNIRAKRSKNVGLSKLCNDNYRLYPRILEYQY